MAQRPLALRALASLLKRLREPEFLGLLVLLGVTITGGTLFYRLTERWTWVDSLYFSVMTLTTVGYGDVTPDSPATKLFTSFYVLVGLGILLGFVGVVTRNAAEASRRLFEERSERKER